MENLLNQKISAVRSAHDLLLNPVPPSDATGVIEQSSETTGDPKATDVEGDGKANAGKEGAASDPLLPESQSRVKRRKKVRFVDTHTQKNFYMDNKVLDVLDEILGDSWGESSRMANDAFRMYLSANYPQYADRLKQHHT